MLVGDVVTIFKGMEIPADGFVLESYDLTCDESHMTGKINPIKKNPLFVCIDIRNKIKEKEGEVSINIITLLLVFCKKL